MLRAPFFPMARRAPAPFLFAVVVVLSAGCTKSRTYTDTGGDQLEPPSPSGRAPDAAAADVAVPQPSGCVDTTSFLAGFAPTRVLYVDPRGSDTADGHSPATAWRSLANASRLQPGDRVDIAAGNYPCSVTLTVQGSAAYPVWIRSSSGPLQAHFDCSGTDGFQLTGARYVALDGLDLFGSPRELVSIGSALASLGGAASDHILIVGCRLGQSGSSCLRIAGASNVEVYGSEFSSPQTYGIQFEGDGIDAIGASNARIVGNYVHDVPTQAGIQVRGGSTGALVAANVIANAAVAVHLGGTTDRQAFVPLDALSEAAGLLVHSNSVLGTIGTPFGVDGCDGCVIANNTVAVTFAERLLRSGLGNAGAQSSGVTSRSRALRFVNNVVSFGRAPTAVLALLDSDRADFSQSNNLYFATATSIGNVPSNPALAGTALLLDVDPLFVDAPHSDVHLSSASRALDAALPLAGVSFDGSLQCRSRWNLGAF